MNDASPETKRVEEKSAAPSNTVDPATYRPAFNETSDPTINLESRFVSPDTYNSLLNDASDVAIKVESVDSPATFIPELNDASPVIIAPEFISVSPLRVVDFCT